MNPWERFKSFDEDHCWQYEIRKQNFKNDLKEIGLSEKEATNLKVKDFEFSYVDKGNKEMCSMIKEFIEKHEWLGKMPNRPTHRFICTYKGHIAGVVVMATPNAFSHLLGKEHKNLEKLIARGACISWAPKNLNSWLVSKSIRWMVGNTEFRYFTAYSDSEAKELGTIYQALNFIYLGKKSGATKMYFDPQRSSKGWFSSREFRKVSAYKKYAQALGIKWNKSWSSKDKMFWKEMNSSTEYKLRQEAKNYQAACIERKVSPKGKYVFIKGKSKKETKKLLEAFIRHNPSLSEVNSGGALIGMEYPKDRSGK